MLPKASFFIDMDSGIGAEVVAVAAVETLPTVKAAGGFSYHFLFIHPPGYFSEITGEGLGVVELVVMPRHGKVVRVVDVFRQYDFRQGFLLMVGLAPQVSMYLFSHLVPAADGLGDSASPGHIPGTEYGSAAFQFDVSLLGFYRLLAEGKEVGALPDGLDHAVGQYGSF